jgi:small subunit ribosomal protein S13e
MGRMLGSGISASCLPYSHKSHAITELSVEEVKKLVIKFAKQGHTESQIGVILRDSYCVPQVRFLTG